MIVFFITWFYLTECNIESFVSRMSSSLGAVEALHHTGMAVMMNIRGQDEEDPEHKLCFCFGSVTARFE